MLHLFVHQYLFLKCITEFLHWNYHWVFLWFCRLYSDGLALGVWFMTSCCCLVEFGFSCFNHASIESWFANYSIWYSTLIFYIGLPCVAPRVASHEAVPLVDEGAEVTPHCTSHSPYQGVAQLLSTPFTMAGPRFSPERGENGCDPLSPYDHDGRIIDRLGRGLRRQTGKREWTEEFRQYYAE